MGVNNKITRLKFISFFYILAILIMISLIIIITTVARPGRVVGDSMLPTLKNGQFITINTINKTNIKPGDIIVYTSPDNNRVVKRVVAVGKSKIKISNGILYINDIPTNYPFSQKDENKDEMEIGDNEFFALGDNRLNSKDSFYYGGVNVNKIIGKVNVNKNKIISIK